MKTKQKAPELLRSSSSEKPGTRGGVVKGEASCAVCTACAGRGMISCAYFDSIVCKVCVFCGGSGKDVNFRKKENQ